MLMIQNMSFQITCFVQKEVDVVYYLLLLKDSFTEIAES